MGWLILNIFLCLIIVGILITVIYILDYIHRIVKNMNDMLGRLRRS